MPLTLEDVRAAIAPEEPDYTAARGLGEDAVPFLVEFVQGNDTHLATKAASLLGIIGGEHAANALRDAAADPRPTVRIAAIATAGNLEPALAEPILIDALRDADPGTRKVALESVPRARTPALDDLVGMIAEGDELPALRTLAEARR